MKKDITKALEKTRLDRKLCNSFINKDNSSRSRGIPFALSLEEYIALVSKTHCELTGLEFNQTSDKLRRSLERINPKIGYTKSNTIAVCCFINTSKGSLDSFVKDPELPNNLKLKFLRQAVYQISKLIEQEQVTPKSGVTDNES